MERTDAKAALAALVQQDVVRIALDDGTVDGTVIEGSYIQQAGMHFVHVKDGSSIGRVEGPVDPASVTAVEVLKDRATVHEEIRERRLGERVPGGLVETRDGYRARLERLAAAAAAEPDYRRRMQIEAQFHEVADRISLARTKRNWMVGEAIWRRHSNEEPDKLDMAGGDLTVAERFRRPKPRDFDPDPVERRKRDPLPERVALDPRSTHNMARAMRAAGFKVRVSLLSEMTDDAVALLVEFPGGKKEGRFLLNGARGADGAMAWRHQWEGGETAAGIRRLVKCKRSETYREFLAVVERGLSPRASDGHEEGPDSGSLPSPRR